MVPFIRTPINLLKFAGERSAFALVPGSVEFGRKRGRRVVNVLAGE